MSRIETSISPSFSVTSQSLLRTLAARDNILSAYPSFELSKFGKIVLTITFSQFFFPLAFFLTFGVSSRVNYG